MFHLSTPKDSMRRLAFSLLIAMGAATLIASPAAAVTMAGPSTATYDRVLLNQWIDAESDGCDTRAEVLITEALSPVTCGETAVVLPAAEVDAVVRSVTISEPDPASVVGVYRFWSPLNKAHFYTTSVAERDHIILSYPTSMWTYEGGVYNAFSSQQPGTVPLYRFWSNEFKGHFFTTSEAEKNSVIADYDDNTWLFEGIAYYVYPLDSTAADTLSVARFWSPNNKHHFYTASAAERDHVKNNYPTAEWTYEGDNFRVPSSAVLVVPPPVVPPVTPPVVIPPGTPTPPGNPGDAKNCADFSTWRAAQDWFNTYYPQYGDVARLDQDNDGIACESLPGHP